MPAEMSLEKMAFNSKVVLSSSIQGLFGAIQVMNSFPGERVLVLRERAAGTYCTSAYFLSKSVAELLFQTPQPIIFSTVVYWLVGFQAEGVCYHARLGTKCAYCYILCISKLKVSADSVHATRLCSQRSQAQGGWHEHVHKCMPISVIKLTPRSAPPCIFGSFVQMFYGRCLMSDAETASTCLGTFAQQTSKWTSRLHYKH